MEIEMVVSNFDSKKMANRSIIKELSKAPSWLKLKISLICKTRLLVGWVSAKKITAAVPRALFVRGVTVRMTHSNIPRYLRRFKVI